jgi:hypothetical protein
MSKSKTNDTHCSLYGWLKDNNTELFNILEDMCAPGLFRPRHPTTFLNPNEKLTQELVKMCDNGEGEEAFKILSSLFIFGKHSKLDGELVSYNRKKYETDLSGLKKDNSFIQWKSKDNTAVFSYDLPKFPKEGKAAQPPKLERKKRDVEGSSEGNHKRITDTEELFKDLDNTDNALFKKVARNLNSLLEHVKSKNPSEFDKIKLLMDPNMVVSWFILVQPTKSTDHHISDDSYNDWELTEFSSITGVETIRSIFESNDKNNDVKDQAKARKDITRVGFKSTQEAVIKAYNNHVKLLEDEIRFRFSDDTTFEKSDINELSHLNWDEPKKSLVIFSNVSDGCLNNPALHSIMTKFIDSNAFKYTLYNAKIHERLTETISGAGNGNSNVKKMISILGNKNRNFIKNMEKTNENKALSKFVSSLTSKQKSSLKELLKNFD